MGSGKTTAMLNYINAHPDTSFIVVTPFLSEVERIKENTTEPFYDPINKGSGKLDSLKRLLGTSCNIVTTHALFLAMDAETENLIREGEYTLILDEVLDVVMPYNDVCANSAKTVEKGDIRFLVDKGSISIDEFGFVSWLDGDKFGDFKFSEVERFAKTQTLICIDEALFLWQFPPRIFALFPQAFILTYLFGGSILKCYFDYYGLTYRLASTAVVDGDFKIVEYVDDRAIRARLKQSITICNDDFLNSIGRKTNALSKSWYLNADKDQYRRLRANANVFIKNRAKASASQIMWTAFKTDYKDLVASGYKYVHRLTAEERKLPERDKSRLSCFVPCNSRATNDFADRTVLMYLINRYPDPNLLKFFAKKNVTFDKKQYALGEMLQWIWRSAIRNGESITIYIPSSRMRQLLIDWLDGK